MGSALEIKPHVEWLRNPDTGLIVGFRDERGVEHVTDFAAALVGAAYGQQKNVLKFCIPGKNTSVEFSDVSGNAATATIDAANTGAFATPGYLATIAATNGGITIAGEKCAINFATDSFILAFVMKRAAPGVNQNLMALHANTVSGGNTGIYLSHRTSGALKIVPVVGASIVNAQNDSALIFSDGIIANAGTWSGTSGTSTITYNSTVPAGIVAGTLVAGANVPDGTTVVSVSSPNVTISQNLTGALAGASLVFTNPASVQDRHCTVVYDAPTGVFSIYRDGVLSNSFTGTPMTGASAFPDAVQSNGFRIGGIASGASTPTVASLTYGEQFYSWTGPLPANIGQVASILANSPRNPLPLGVLNV